jgi:hypothetical protein
MNSHAVDIGDVIFHGVVFDPKNSERVRTMDADELVESVPRLFELLEERQVEYLLVGGIAMLVYVQGRNTQDIDLIVARDQLSRVPEIILEEENPNFALGRLGQLRLDFLLTNNKLFDLIKKDYASRQKFAEREIRCATVEGLLMLKLYALPDLYRQGRFDKVRAYRTDIADLLELRPKPEVAQLWSELSRHLLPSDLEELQKIVTEIEDEQARDRDRFRKSIS